MANGTLAAFPDAPTVRGLKHVETLLHAQREGYRSFLLFIVQLPGINAMTIYHERFPELAPAITLARANGVQVLAYGCVTGPDSITLGCPVTCDETLSFAEVQLTEH